MANRLNLERVARILVEAEYHKDQEVCEKYGITTRTLRNYRKKLAENSKLSDIFRLKEKKYSADWAQDASVAISSAFRFLGKVIDQTDLKEADPAMIRAVAGAVKIMTQAEQTKRMIDARISEPDRED